MIRSGHIHWISDVLSKAIKLVPTSLTIDIRIHITGSGQQQLSANQSFDDDSVHSRDNEEEKSKRSASIMESPCVQVASGRPDIQAILREEQENTIGCLSVSGK